MKNGFCIAGCLAVMLVLLPALARAEGTTCGLDTVITPDGREIRSQIPASTTYWFFFDSVAGHSYSAEFKTLDAPGGSGGATASFGTPGTLAAFGDFSCATPLAGTRDIRGIDPVDSYFTRRISFTATAGGTRFTITRGASGTANYSFSVSDTTMYSASWSTSSTYDTFYSFLNTTNATINGTLRLYRTDGTLESTTVVAIPSGQTAATNTSALATTRNQAGTARFTHDGPPGAVLIEAAIANFSLTPPYIQPVKFDAPRERQ